MMRPILPRIGSCKSNNVVRKSNSSIKSQRNFSTERELGGSKTHANLIEAFKGESMVKPFLIKCLLILKGQQKIPLLRHQSWYILKNILFSNYITDIEGKTDVARLFRDTADGKLSPTQMHIIIVILHLYDILCLL